MSQAPRKSLGERLVDKGKITPEQLDEVLGELKERPGQRFGGVIVDMGFVQDKDIVEELSEQMGIPFWQLDLENMPLESAGILTSEEATQMQAVPVKLDGGILEVAMVDPLNLETVDTLKKSTRKSIKPFFATASDIQLLIEELIRIESTSGIDVLVDPTSMDGFAEDSSESIVEAVNSIIDKAVDAKASDIHIESFESHVKVRYRIDGVMHVIQNLPGSVSAALISRLKIMSELDIAERRIPQDGRIRFDHQGEQVDIRISTYPGVNGENVVMRILDQRKGLLKLDQLGFSDHCLEKYRDLLHRTGGIILITGPTGSGKTTSLYGGLAELDANEMSILTLEDPVEYRLEGVRQSQVNPKAGFQFADGLRAMVRQDPDVIMFGEIRDKETAQIAIQSALTGHLVFSTLHTNDAVGSVTRLVNMGIEPFLISSSLIGVLAQRLVRRLCDKCKQITILDEKTLQNFADHQAKLEGARFYEAVGCDTCMNTGYSGRLGIYELLEVTEAVQHSIVLEENSQQIAAVAKSEGFVDMREDGLIKARQGLTTLEEVLRVS